MWIDGQLTLNESDAVKMCIVLIPIVVTAVVALIAVVAEKISNRNSVDLAETEEGKKLLAYMIGDEK